jgi:hydroxymethylpyrimidine/phosphomethylpyrimidine kinase
MSKLEMPTMRVAMTIAGSDSSGGAGIQADLKTFTRCGVFGMSAITAITAQNTTGVVAAFGLPTELLVQQIDYTVSDIRPHAVKTGMLATVEVIDAVAAALQRHALEPYVCDPVVTAKSGAVLIDAGAIEAIRNRLVPRATVVTPNRHEAAQLCGFAVGDVAAARRAAEALCEMGAYCAVIKSIPRGHERVDVVAGGDGSFELSARAMPDGQNHGSGCTFAAAITARLALRDSPEDAIRFAHAFVQRAIGAAPHLGAGVRPVNHLA